MLVSVTTIREGDPTDPIEALRATVFLDTAQSHRDLGLPLFAVFVDCSDVYLEKLTQLGVTLEHQSESRMGGIRRQALRSASSAFPHATHFLWCEPEKPAFAQIAFANAEAIVSSGDTSYFFNRLSMTSYPAEQAHYYLFARSVASALLLFDFDYAFGPMILARCALRHFVEYRSEYGDLWDSILVPRLRLMKSGLPFQILNVAFQNDCRMTKVETGHPGIILKRLQQLNNVIPSLVHECKLLAKHGNL